MRLFTPTCDLLSFSFASTSRKIPHLVPLSYEISQASKEEICYWHKRFHCQWRLNNVEMSFSDQWCTNFNFIQSISTYFKMNHLHNKTLRDRHFLYSVRSAENLLHLIHVLECSSCLNLLHYGNWNICTAVHCKNHGSFHSYLLW